MTFQHEELQDLKQILGQMRGQTVERASLPHGVVTDLRSLHPKGKARFEKDHVSRRMARHVPHKLGDAVAAVALPPVSGDS
jgi:hypothetical protein